MRTSIASIRTRTSSAVCIFLLGCLSGCASGKLGPAEQIDTGATLRPEEISRIKSMMTEFADQEGTATHRVLLSIGRREFDLNSRLAISPQLGLRLVALVSMGQVMMDVWIKPGGEHELMREPLGMRSGWIEKFVVRDLEILYQSMGEEDYDFARVREGTALAYRNLGPDSKNGPILRHRFDLDSGRWLGAEIVRGERRIWLAENRSSDSEENVAYHPAREIYIAAPRYELHINTTTFDPGPAEGRLFRNGQGEGK